MGKPVVDLAGRTIGKWSVLERGPNDRHSQARWYCKCECGEVHLVCSGNLRKGTSLQCRSCGLTKHGEYRGGKSVEAQTLEDIIQRCTNPDNEWYPEYGGRGVTVCDRWRGEHGITNFIADMGRRPDGLTIDRIDTNGPYSPDNCRWASRSEQQRNRRCNKLITAFGKTQCLAAWAEETGLRFGLIYWRLSAGWSPERAVSEPSQRRAVNVLGTSEVQRHAA